MCITLSNRESEFVRSLDITVSEKSERSVLMTGVLWRAKIGFGTLRFGVESKVVTIVTRIHNNYRGISVSSGATTIGALFDNRSIIGLAAAKPTMVKRKSTQHREHERHRTT